MTNEKTTIQATEKRNTQELRRLMYERIAQGQALTETEDNARHKWQNR